MSGCLGVEEGRVGILWCGWHVRGAAVRHRFRKLGRRHRGVSGRNVIQMEKLRQAQVLKWRI